MPGAVPRALDRAGGAQQAVVFFGDDARQQMQRLVVFALNPPHLVAAAPFDDAGMIAVTLDQLADGPLEIAQEDGVGLRAAAGHGELLRQHDAEFVRQIEHGFTREDAAAPDAQGVHARGRRHLDEPGTALVHAAKEQIRRQQIRADHAHRSAIDDELVGVDEVFGRAFHLPPADVAQADARAFLVQALSRLAIQQTRAHGVERLIALAQGPPQRRVVDFQRGLDAVFARDQRRPNACLLRLSLPLNADFGLSLERPRAVNLQTRRHRRPAMVGGQLGPRPQPFNAGVAAGFQAEVLPDAERVDVHAPIPAVVGRAF